MRALLDRHLGEGWLAAQRRRATTWEAVGADPRPPSCGRRAASSASRLIDAVRERSVRERLGRGEPLAYARAAAETFDPDALTIGFARRIATYKRLGLLVEDLDGARELLGGPRPVQIVLAGKAHPARRGRQAHARRRCSSSSAASRASASASSSSRTTTSHSAALLVQGC